MKDLTVDERKFLAHMNRTKSVGTPIWLATIAIICTIAEESHVDPPDGHTRGDFKRAIRVLREAQAIKPEFTKWFEAAVMLIRRDWLHREEAPT